MFTHWCLGFFVVVELVNVEFKEIPHQSVYHVLKYAAESDSGMNI